MSVPSPDSPDEKPEEPNGPKRAANRLTTTLIMLEGTLGVVGLVGGYWTGIDWVSLIRFTPLPFVVGLAAGVGLFVLHVVLLFPGGQKNPLYRWIYQPFEEVLVHRLRLLSLEDIFLISLMSGLAEEIMFRGWIQNELGIVVASVLFGLVHIWGQRGLGYGIYAIGMGFILGGLYMYTGSLWAPAAAHILNNLIGLLSIKFDWTPG